MTAQRERNIACDGGYISKCYQKPIGIAERKDFPTREVP
jgi:hypothetical protein